MPKPKRSKRRAATSGSKPSKTSKQNESPTKPLLDSKDYPNLLTPEEIASMTYSKENVQRIFQHCVEASGIVQEKSYPHGVNENMKPPSHIFKQQNYRNFFSYVWQMTEASSSDPKKIFQLSLGLDGVKAIFWKFFKIHISIYFVDDQQMQETFDRESWSEFVKRCTVYHCRVSQNSCAVKDCCCNATKEKRFGGAGYMESDHPLQNGHEVVGVLKKSFCFCIGDSSHKTWPAFLAELALTLWTCSQHHQHDASAETCYHRLSSEVSKEVKLVDSNGHYVEIENALPMAPCLVQDSEEGRQLEQLTDKYCEMSNKKLSLLEFDDVKDDYDEKAPLPFEDMIRVTPEKWNECNAAQRRVALRRAEITATKKLARSCFRCGKNAFAVPARDSHNLHLHHMLAKLKGFNPSQGVYKSDIGEQRSENRKTIMLCCGCHTLITHCYSANDELVAKFERLGYVINETTGEISCTQAPDDLCIEIP